MSRSEKGLPDWPWTGLFLSGLYLILVFSLACLGSRNCHQPTAQSQKSGDTLQAFTILCAETKCTVTKEQTEYSKAEPCDGAICWGWNASHRYLGLIGDDPIALFTALLFISTGLLWWVTRNTWKHAQESSERELRAYVGIERIYLESPNLHRPEYDVPQGPFGDGFVYPDKVRIRVKNSGKTPASDVAAFVSWYSFTPFGAGIPPGTVLQSGITQDQIETASRAILDSGSSFSFTITIRNSLEPFRRAIERKSTLYFDGHIEYTDIFGAFCSRKFRYSWEPWRDDQDMLVPAREGNVESRVSN